MWPPSALTGITVVEVAAYIPGPLCTQILADMGANVIKIERPGGDPMRTLIPCAPNGENPFFSQINRNKQHIELDLKQPEDVTRLRAIARTADVVVDGFRPGVLERLGVGAAALQLLNPRLVYLGLSGYGDNSPMRDVGGHDLNYVALSGFLGHTLVGDTPPMPGTHIADMISGLAAATAVLGALQARERTGVGSLLDFAMSDAAYWLMLPGRALVAAGMPTPHPATYTGALACYNIYPTFDGRHLVVGALEPHFWQRFCEAIEHPELIAIQYDPSAQQHIHTCVAECIVTQPLAYWINIFSRVDACVTPALTLEEAAALPLHRARMKG